MSASLISFQSGHRTTNNLYRWTAPNEPWLVKVYRGPSARERCLCERELLQLWHGHGLAVPAVHTRVFPQLAGLHYLVMTELVGLDLSALLQSPDAPHVKLDCLAKVFRANRRRHELALSCRDIRLIHPDLNSRNVLICDGQPWHIDLESVCRGATLTDSIAIEIAKLCRWVARDMGRAWLDDAVRLLLECYAGQEWLLSRIIDRTSARSFQFIHRWRDRTFKAAFPDEVTKYDVSDCLRRRLPDAA